MILILAAAPGMGANQPEGDAVRGNNQFAFGLYQRLRKEGDGNVFFSPISLSTALAMTSLGARDRTLDEMSRVLHVPLGESTSHTAYRSLLDNLRQPPADRGYQLRLGNHLWAQTGHPFVPPFLDATRSYYGAALDQVEFSKPESARETINRWADKATEGQVKELIPPGLLEPNARLVITNTVSFRGEWHYPFDPKKTRPGQFLTSSGTKVPVPLMHRTGEYRFAELERLSLLEITYGKGLASALFILPAKAAGLAALENALNVEALDHWSESLAKQEVRVYLPRLTLMVGASLSRASGPGDATRFRRRV